MTWDGSLLSGPVIGMVGGKDGDQLNGVEATTLEGRSVVVPLRRLSSFFRAHLDESKPLFVACKTVELFAEILHRSEELGDADLAEATWCVLKANRALDRDISSRLLELAGIPATEVEDDLPLTLVNQGEQQWRRLEDRACHHGVPQEVTARFGPLSQGLQVGCAVALKKAEKRRLRFRQGQLASLRRDVVRQRDEVFHRLLAGNSFNKFVRPQLKHGYPDLKTNQFKAWRSGRLDELIDSRDIGLRKLLRSNDLHEFVDRWPLWALGASGAYQWRQLRRLCRLAKDLEGNDDENEVTHSFAVLPDLIWESFDFTASDIEEAFKGLTTSGVRNVHRVRLPHLRLMTLVRHLVCDHHLPDDQIAGLFTLLAATNGERRDRYTPQQAFFLLAASGMWLDGAARLAREIAGEEYPTAHFDRLRADRRGILQDHLADHSLAQIERSLGCSPGEWERLVPGISAKAVTEVVYQSYGAFSPTLNQQLREVILERLARSEIAQSVLTATRLSPHRISTMRFKGIGTRWYREVTDEAIVLPSGMVRSGRLWIEARFAETIQAAEEALKSVIFHLAAEGDEVLGFEEEAVWVTTTHQGSSARQRVLEQALVPLLGDLWRVMKTGD